MMPTKANAFANTLHMFPHILPLWATYLAGKRCALTHSHPKIFPFFVRFMQTAHVTFHAPLGYGPERGTKSNAPMGIIINGSGRIFKCGLSGGRRTIYISVENNT